MTLRTHRNVVTFGSSESDEQSEAESEAEAEADDDEEDCSGKKSARSEEASTSNKLLKAF